MTPAKNQQSRGTCWVFCTLGFLEASYRAYGYRKGWLGEDEYVSFSEQAYGLGVVDYCNAHPGNALCYGSGPGNNSTEDGEPEMLYYFGSDVQRVLPEAACPYYGDNAQQTVCADREAKLGKNPLSFRVRGIETAYSLSGIKELLVKHGQPLTWSDSIFEQTYMVRCDSREGLAATEVCKRCVYPVSPTVTPGADGYAASQCYALYLTNTYGTEGAFALHGKPFLAGGHGLLLVGYNDNFRVNTGRADQLGERTVGGFIVKNSWGGQGGHSLRYWSQEISLMEENLLCPNERSARNWLAVDTMCVLGGGSVAECSAAQGEAYKRVRGEWQRGATVLKCVPVAHDRGVFLGFTECAPEKRYVLAGAPQLGYNRGGQPSGLWLETPADSDGLFRVNLFEYDPAAPAAPAVRRTTGLTTLENLERLFEPEHVVGNDESQCGYYFYPYQYFQEAAARMPAFGHDALGSVTYYDVEWHPSSFIANRAQYPDRDYTYLEQSRRRMPVYNFTGPIDFKEVYPPH